MEKKSSRTRMDLTQGSIMGKLIIFSLPIFAGTIMTELYSVVDSIVVGKVIGSGALAAVSASQPVTQIINLFMIGLSTGSNVVIAQRTGTKRLEALQNAMNTIAVLTLALGVLITVCGLAAAKPLLMVMDTPEDIFGTSLSYIVIIFLGTMGNLMYQIGSGALRGMGDSTWPFLFLCVCSVIHVVLDIIVVKILGLGVWSVAASTAVSQLLSGIGIIWRINTGDYGVRLGFKTLKVDKTEAKEIVSIGLPAALQQIGNSLAAICVQGYVNGFGSNFISANSVVTKLENFANMPINAVSTAISTFVAQNIGLFKMKRIKKGVNMSMALLVLLGIVCCGALIIGRGVLPKLFVDEPEVISIAAEGIFALAFVCTFHGIDRVLVNAMRGAGKSVVPMVTAQLGAFSRIPLAYFMAARTGDYMGIFYAMLIASFIRTAAIAVYYFCGGWKRTIGQFEARHAADREAMLKAGVLLDD